MLFSSKRIVKKPLSFFLTHDESAERIHAMNRQVVVRRATYKEMET